MILVALLASLALQDGPPEVVRCNPRGTTPEVNACFIADLAREEARMERYLETAATRAYRLDDESAPYDYARTQQRAWLNASQTAWRAYVDTRCPGVFDQWRGVTIRTVKELTCRIETTRQRTHDIWSDHLTYQDSSPPILPEPVGPPSAE